MLFRGLAEKNNKDLPFSWQIIRPSALPLVTDRRGSEWKEEILLTLFSVRHEYFLPIIWAKVTPLRIFFGN